VARAGALNSTETPHEFSKIQGSLAVGRHTYIGIVKKAELTQFGLITCYSKNTKN